MQILLLSMPDSFEHTPTIAVRMPNGGLASLAGNVDSHHQVAIADLILAQSSVQATVIRLMEQLQPRLVGLSVMTFQRGTARRIISLIRSIKPDVLVAVGGYDPSLAPEAWTDPSLGVDFIVRGEGDLTFRELLRAIEGQGSLSNISGLWFRSPDGFQRNPARPATTLKDGDVRPPSRAARVLSGYTMMGRSIDVVETSRGCTFDCSFCSIIEMRGRNFYRFSIDRVIADIRDAHDRGARSIFLVDDNITIDVPRLEALCRAIIEDGLDDIMYVVQAMTAAIATHGASLAPLMRRAGFRYVFLGIENVLEDDLAFLRATAKNSRKQENTTLAAVNVLHQHGLLVVGGLIVGNPDDTRSSIETNLAYAVSRHTDDARLPRARTHRQSARRGIRRNVSSDTKRASRRRRNRVHALEGRALDESPPHSDRLSASSRLCAQALARNDDAYLSRNHLALAHRSGIRARHLPPLSSDPCAGT